VWLSETEKKEVAPCTTSLFSEISVEVVSLVVPMGFVVAAAEVAVATFYWRQ